MSPSLPEEIIFDEILTRVPSDVLRTLGCVCKLWFHHIAKSRPMHIIPVQRFQQIPPLEVDVVSYRVTTLHLEVEFVFNSIARTVSASVCNEHILPVSNITGLPPPPEITILGSCNGLILLKERSSCTVLRLANPATKRWVNLPCSNRHSRKGGLGYDRLGKTFKAVVFLDWQQEDCSSGCEVLTQGSNAWRAIDFPFETGNVADNPAIVVGGFMHFAYRRYPGPGYDYMLSLDVGDETFRLSKLPIRALYLLRIDDSVALIAYDAGGCQLDILILKDHGDETWAKMHSISVDPIWLGGCCFPDLNPVAS